MNLLKAGLTKGPQRRAFLIRTLFENPIGAERASFDNLQAAMRHALIHMTVFFDHIRQLYVEIDSSKDEGHSVMIFHVKKDWVHTDMKKPPPANVVEPIMFLSR